MMYKTENSLKKKLQRKGIIKSTVACQTLYRCLKSHAQTCSASELSTPDWRPSDLSFPPQNFARQENIQIATDLKPRVDEMDDTNSFTPVQYSAEKPGILPLDTNIGPDTRVVITHSMCKCRIPMMSLHDNVSKLFGNGLRRIQLVLELPKPESD